MTHEDKPLLNGLLNQNPNLPFWFNTSLGILLTLIARLLNHNPTLHFCFTTILSILLPLIGSITIFQLLTTPMPHFPEVIPESMCYPASDLLSPPEDIELSGDSAGTITNDHCSI